MERERERATERESERERERERDLVCLDQRVHQLNRCGEGHVVIEVTVCNEQLACSDNGTLLINKIDLLGEPCDQHL